MDDKKELRKQYINRRNAISEDEQCAKSCLIREQLFVLEEYRKAKSIFTYIGFGSEVKTREIIIQAFKDGKKAAVPIVKDGGVMDFMEILGFENLKISDYGILEPYEGKVVLPDKDSLMLVPGLVFGYDRYRIGYGRGYYDRYLARVETMTNIGLAYASQIIQSVPHNADDCKMDAILTDEGMIV